MCAIHHRAFDANVLGIRPDHVVEIRRDILDEIDGPMLRHGLQEMAGTTITRPGRALLAPDPSRLEERYEQSGRQAEASRARTAHRGRVCGPGTALVCRSRGMIT
jgi:putative restriction endonuclease